MWCDNFKYNIHDVSSLQLTIMARGWLERSKCFGPQWSFSFCSLLSMSSCLRPWQQGNDSGLKSSRNSYTYFFLSVHLSKTFSATSTKQKFLFYFYSTTMEILYTGKTFTRIMLHKVRKSMHIAWHISTACLRIFRMQTNLTKYPTREQCSGLKPANSARSEALTTCKEYFLCLFVQERTHLVLTKAFLQL